MQIASRDFGVVAISENISDNSSDHSAIALFVSQIVFCGHVDDNPQEQNDAEYPQKEGHLCMIVERLDERVKIIRSP